MAEPDGGDFEGGGEEVGVKGRDEEPRKRWVPLRSIFLRLAVAKMKNVGMKPGR